MATNWVQTSINITINLNLKNKACQANIYKFEKWLSNMIKKHNQTNGRIGIKKIGDMTYQLYDLYLDENQSIGKNKDFNRLFTRLGLSLAYYWGNLYKISISSSYEERKDN